MSCFIRTNVPYSPRDVNVLSGGMCPSPQGTPHSSPGVNDRGLLRRLVEGCLRFLRPHYTISLASPHLVAPGEQGHHAPEKKRERWTKDANVPLSMTLHVRPVAHVQR